MADDSYSWIGPVVQGAVSMFGEQQAGKLDKQQLDLLRQQYEELKNVPLPELQRVLAERLGPSELGGLHSDEQARGNQLDMLAELRNVIDQGGLSLSDRAALADAMGDASAQARRGRANVKADLARRGGLDSGAQLMASMQSASDSARDAGKAGLETAAMAERRKLDAMRAHLDATGAMRGQDWAENSATAGARDRRAEGNADRREKAGYYNAGLPQQQFENRTRRLGMATGPGTNLAGAYAGQAQGTRNFWGNMGATANSAAQKWNQSNSGSSDMSTWDEKERRDYRGDRGGYADLSSDDEDWK